tara:strand:+ start:660 stop:1112 length:453 start_codon:yes stop_codon:yes gene_type:complete
MSVKLVFIILGTIFYVFRQFSKSKDIKNSQTAGSRSKRANRRPKSIDDIFKEFVQEVESNKKPAEVEVKAAGKSRTSDWQELDGTQLKQKEQLNENEDYPGVSHRINKKDQVQDFINISSSEGEVFDFDYENIDWQNAIITKEILDRKYT